MKRASINSYETRSKASAKRKRAVEGSSELEIHKEVVHQTRATKRTRHHDIDTFHLSQPLHGPNDTVYGEDAEMLDAERYALNDIAPARAPHHTANSTEEVLFNGTQDGVTSAIEPPEVSRNATQTVETTVFDSFSSEASKYNSESSELGKNNDTEFTRYSEAVAKPTSNANQQEPHRKITCSEAKWNRLLNDPGHGLKIHIVKGELMKLATQGGGLSVEGLSDLDNDIPTLLDQRNWPMIDWTTEENSKLWAAMLPCLRLVGKLMEERKVKDYFRHLALGEVVYRRDVKNSANEDRENQGEKNGKPECKYIRETAVERTARKNNDYSSVEAGFQVLMRKGMSFHFGLATLKDGFQCQGCCCQGEEHFPHNVCLKEDSTNFPRGKDKGHIILHDALRVALLNENLSKEQKVLTMFNTASTLFHELGHAFWSRHRDAGDPWEPEPCYDYFDLRAELGEALEIEAFGVLFAAVTTTEQGSDIEWQPLLRGSVDEQAVATNSHLSFPLDPKWCLHLFSKKKWQEMEITRDPIQKRIQLLQGDRSALAKAEIELGQKELKEVMEKLFHPPSEFGVAQDGRTKEFRVVSNHKSKGVTSVNHWKDRDAEGIHWAVGKLHRDYYGHGGRVEEYRKIEELDMKEPVQRATKKRKKFGSW
ncbi:hypothetical protein BDV96DRAFT_603182 [Lophiotrema nucula]|uniref:Uncharacterized protein n=1 Tax=Lophiotrema nucula TaxID=690887 RepID=A0A6A5YWY3_9PLEO|nr:hypothetical protein BDV96DRAFT_603182 [Lophiotrema nucula]